MNTLTHRITRALRHLRHRLHPVVAAVRARLLRATLRLADKLRGPADPEIVLRDSDIEVLTPRSLKALEAAMPELAIPRRPLAEAVVRRGWMVVGQATILGLGSPVLPSAPIPNERDLDPSTSSPAWQRPPAE